MTSRRGRSAAPGRQAQPPLRRDAPRAGVRSSATMPASGDNYGQQQRGSGQAGSASRMRAPLAGDDAVGAEGGEGRDGCAIGEDRGDHHAELVDTELALPTLGVRSPRVDPAAPPFRPWLAIRHGQATSETRSSSGSPRRRPWPARRRPGRGRSAPAAWQGRASRRPASAASRSAGVPSAPPRG